MLIRKQKNITRIGLLVKPTGCKENDVQHKAEHSHPSKRVGTVLISPNEVD